MAGNWGDETPLLKPKLALGPKTAVAAQSSGLLNLCRPKNLHQKVLESNLPGVFIPIRQTDGPGFNMPPLASKGSVVGSMAASKEVLKRGARWCSMGFC